MPDTPAHHGLDTATRLLLIAYGLGIALLASIFVVNRITGIPIRYFTSDPAMVSEIHLYNGFVSNLGVLAWAAAAVGCLLTWLVLRGRGQKRLERYLLASGAISFLLMFDDLYLIHDFVMGDLLRVPEIMAFGGYALVLIGYLAFFSRDIFQTRYKAFAAAMALLALSIGIDLAQLVLTSLLGSESLQYLLEDGFKFLGIIGWSGYFLVTCVESLQRALRRPAIDGLLIPKALDSGTELFGPAGGDDYILFPTAIKLDRWSE